MEWGVGNKLNYIDSYYIQLVRMERRNEQNDCLADVQPITKQAKKQKPKVNLINKYVICFIIVLFVFVLICWRQTIKKCEAYKVSQIQVNSQYNIEASTNNQISKPLSSQPIDDQSNNKSKELTHKQQLNKQQPVIVQTNELKSQQSLQTDMIQSKKLNLWDLPKDLKIKLLKQVKTKENIDYTPFLHDKDQQTKQFFIEYESSSEVINWANISLKQSTIDQIIQSATSKLNQLNTQYNKEVDRLQKAFNKNVGYMGENNKGITYSQFFTALKLKKLLMTYPLQTTTSQVLQMQAEQRNAYQQKYKVSQYEQLPACIVMPTYNNMKDLRYIWSIQSILQQEYTNLKVIIIDDGSQDSTVEHTANYLKWRNADPQRYILISSKQHRAALQNIYYGAHKYCDYGQIFFIIDGDDQLIGRQTFKVFNAVYQKQKYYSLYTQFISYNPKSKNKLDIGISQEFPTIIKKKNSYRTFKHSYSQLRSVLIQFYYNNDRFFSILYDNALFYPAFEMSCQKVAYLPEIFYWYNINTGSNDWRQAKTALYRQNRYGIQLQKPYHCIDQQLQKVNNTK